MRKTAILAIAAMTLAVNSSFGQMAYRILAVNTNTSTINYTNVLSFPAALNLYGGADWVPGVPSGNPALGSGRLYANEVAGRTALYWKQNNGTIIRYGRDTVFTGINDEAFPLTNGAVVYFTAGKISNTTHYLKLAKADTALTLPAQGIVADGGSPVAPGGYVNIMYIGRTDTSLGINTVGQGDETWTNSDVLYVSPTVAGGLTKIKPSAPYYIQDMGLVNAVSDTAGSIDMRTKMFQQATDSSVFKTWNLWSASNSVLNTAYRAMRTLDYGQTGVGIWTNNAVTNRQYIGYLSGPAGAGMTQLKANQVFTLTPTVWFTGSGSPRASIAAEMYIRGTNGVETELTPASGTESQALSTSALKLIFQWSFTNDITMLATDRILIKFKVSGVNGTVNILIGSGAMDVPTPSSQYVLTSDFNSFKTAAVVGSLETGSNVKFTGLPGTAGSSGTLYTNATGQLCVSP